MKIDLSNEIADKAAQAIETLGNEGKKAVAKALNRANAGVKTDASRVVRTRYNIKAGTIKESFTTGKRASSKGLMASTKSTGSRTPLIAFSASPARPGGRKPPGGVSVKVRNTRKRIPGSFVAKMKNGHVGVFKRSGDYGRNDSGDLEKIEELHTLAVPQAIEWEEKAQGKISDMTAERFDKRLDHEIGRALEKMGAR